MLMKISLEYLCL